MIHTGKTIQIGGKDLTIKPLNVEKTLYVVASVDNIPAELSGLMNKKEASIPEVIGVIARNLRVFARPIVTAVNNKEFTEDILLKELTLVELYDLLETLFEINQFDLLYDRLKKNKLLKTYFSNPQERAKSLSKAQ